MFEFALQLQSSLKFIIPDLTKTSGPGKIAAQVVLSQYDRDKKICVIRCLTKHLSRTLRHSSSSKLFLRLQMPFRPVGSETLRRWIKTILNMSGVRTDIFGSHSTRSVSSSKAKLAGLSVDSVLESVGWFNEQTFARYYNRNIVDITAFSNAVLNSVV